MATPSYKVGMAGKAFFGSLCVGTFGLGVWQSQRYLAKVQLLEQRQTDLKQAPLPYDARTALADNNNNTKNSAQRYTVVGTFDHDHEFLVGPRGKPAETVYGVGGVSPQGYFVLTPCSIGQDNNNNNNNNNTVLVNRGWVPRKKVVPEITHSRGLTPVRRTHTIRDWERPTGRVSLVVVPSKVESPKMLVAEHNLPDKILFWFDRPAMLALSNTRPPLQYVTQVIDEEDKKSSGTLVHQLSSNIGRPKIEPSVHVGYAVTWYSLSVAGMFMLRKLVK